MDENELLFRIYSMRCDIDYHKAEVLRRQLQAKGNDTATMAAAKPGSDENAAVHILIGTWNTIAVLMRGVKGRDKIYEVNPICGMYQVLQPGITYLRKATPEFAVDFEKLNVDYHAWLKKKKKSASYVTAHCNDQMNARFG
jgi:hypothetical protein